MVSNGVVLVGDAASLVNPIHGGGIGPSMLSGYLAGQQIVDALSKGEPTKEALWGYNKKYIDTYGKKQGTLDIFKMFLLSCSDEDLNYGMNEKLMTEDDVLKAGMGDDFHLNITETAKRVFRGIRRVGFLNKLRLTVTMMRGLSAHYNTYPTSPQNFEPWRLQTVKLIEEATQTRSNNIQLTYYFFLFYYHKVRKGLNLQVQTCISSASVKNMVYCSNCGSQLADDAYFCPKCGTKTDRGKAAKATYPADELRDAFYQVGAELERAFTIAAQETHKAILKARDNLQQKTSSPEPIVLPQMLHQKSIRLNFLPQLWNKNCTN